MSKKEKGASAGEQEESGRHSVFDFLYYDHQRIGSFLAQFFDDGLLEKVLQKETVGTVRQRGFKFAVGGGGTLVGTGGSATVGVERSPGETGGEETQRIYDPLWANARVFLDYLNNNSLINADLESTPIGRFVYFKGDLTVVDLGIVGKTWGKPSIQNLMSAGSEAAENNFPAVNRKDRRRQGFKNSSTAPLSTQTQLFIDLLDVLPHTAQAYLRSPDAMVWCGLREEALIVQTGDILLKHGFSVEGEWAVLGILDAKPQVGPETTSEEHISTLGFNSEIGQGLAASLMLTIAPIARNVLGRPPQAFGMTPLLIFREVSG